MLIKITLSTILLSMIVNIQQFLLKIKVFLLIPCETLFFGKLLR